jgi:hypothetical protein
VRDEEPHGQKCSRGMAGVTWGNDQLAFEIKVRLPVELH